MTAWQALCLGPRRLGVGRPAAWLRSSSARRSRRRDLVEGGAGQMEILMTVSKFGSICTMGANAWALKENDWSRIVSIQRTLFWISQFWEYLILHVLQVLDFGVHFSKRFQHKRISLGKRRTFSRAQQISSTTQPRRIRSERSLRSSSSRDYGGEMSFWITICNKMPINS